MPTDFLCISVLRVASGPRVKLASCKSALTPAPLPPPPPPRVVYFTDRSKAVVPVLAICFMSYPVSFCSCVALQLPHLGKRELILVLFLRLFDLCLFGFVGFLFLLVSGK